MTTKHSFHTSHYLGREKKLFPVKSVFPEKANRAWMSTVYVCLQSLCLRSTREGVCWKQHWNPICKIIREAGQICWLGNTQEASPRPFLDTSTLHYIRTQNKQGQGLQLLNPDRNTMTQPFTQINFVFRFLKYKKPLEAPATAALYNIRAEFCCVKAMLMLKRNFPQPNSHLVQLKLCKEGKTSAPLLQGLPLHMGICRKRQLWHCPAHGAAPSPDLCFWGTQEWKNQGNAKGGGAFNSSFFLLHGSCS